MNLKYKVINKSTGQVLHRSGEWVAPSSYRHALFDTEEAAVAAFPADTECAAHLTALRVAFEDVCFYVRMGGAYLSRSGEMNVQSSLMWEAQPFWTEDEALDRAEELGFDLSVISVDYGSTRQVKQIGAAGLVQEIVNQHP